MPPAIRRARADDASTIAALLGELGYPTAVDEVQRRLGALGADDLVLLAQEGEGMVSLHRVRWLAEGGAFVRITALVVTQRARGRGVARALLAATEEAARQWDCGVIEVSSARREERAAAHRLYIAAGFTDTSPRSVRYWKPV